jgi:hypothetical protein
MNRHRLVRDGDVIRVYTNGRLTRMGFNTDKTTDIRSFIRDSGLTDPEVDQKMKELFSLGETAITHKV